MLTAMEIVRRPSQLAEMLAEIEMEGYTLFQTEKGWNARILSEEILTFPTKTREECIEAAHQYVFNPENQEANRGRRRADLN